MAQVNWDDSKETRDVLFEVYEERLRQTEKWGVQEHPMGTGPSVELFGYEIKDLLGFVTNYNDENDNPFWGTILLEEVLEALAETEDSENLRKELLQVAAVAVAAVENLDRKR